MRLSRILRRGWWVGGVLIPVAAAWGGSPSYTTVADTTTVIPGGSGKFTGFSPGPAIDGGSVAFSATGSTNQAGVYLSQSGGLSALVDKKNTIPGGAGRLASAPNDPCFSDDNAVFFATTTGEGAGIYTSAQGSLSVAADTATAIPNAGKTTFTTFGDTPSISGGATAFAGSSATAGGIYLSTTAGLSVVADNSTAIPNGTGNFNFTNGTPNDPCISGSNVGFVGSGSGGQQGVYLSTSSSLTRIADTSTAIPGGNGNFTSFPADPCLSGDNIAFVGNGVSNQQGFYANFAGVLTKIADTNTAIPGGSGNFLFNAAPPGPCIDGSNVLIEEQGSGGQEGIYFWSGGVLNTVVDLNSTIEGKTIESLGMGRVALSGDEAVFSAEFTDGTSGIFETMVPEPGVMGCVIVGMIGTAPGMGRRKRKP